MSLPTDAVPTPRRAAVVFVFLTVVLDMIALGVVVPVLPKLIEQFYGGDTPRAAETYGWFNTVWAAMQFFCAPLLGALSDRWGRRPVILLSNLGLGLDYILMALAPSLPWLFVGRVISGLTAASVPTAGAYIADVTPPEKRAGAFGLIGAAFGIGFVVGPALGGVLGGIDPRLPFWVAAGFSLANALYGAFVLPESLPPERRGAFAWRRANPVGALNLLRSHPELLGLSFANFLVYLAHEVLPSVFVLYAGHRYGWTTTEVGLTLAVVGVCSGAIQGAAVKPLVARFGERALVLAGATFGVIGFVFFGGATAGWVFLLGIPFLSLWGLFGSAAQGIMSRHVAADEQGQLQGAITSLRGITGMIGPVLFTWVFARFLAPTSGPQIPGAAWWLAAAFAALSGLAAWRALRGEQGGGWPSRQAGDRSSA